MTTAIVIIILLIISLITYPTILKYAEEEATPQELFNPIFTASFACLVPVINILLVIEYYKRKRNLKKALEEAEELEQQRNKTNIYVRDNT